MGVIYPFRNIKTATEQVECALCHEQIASTEAYSVMSEGTLDGYVCEECFAQFYADAQPHRRVN